MTRLQFPSGGGGSSFTAQNLSSDTTLSTFDLAFVDGSGGARTITMPASPSDGDAVQIVAVDTSGGNIIFAANSGQSLSGLPNLQNAGEGAVFRYRASDSTWYGTTADVLDRLYDTANDALTSQVGTSSNRQDVFAAAMDAQSASIDELNADVVLDPSDVTDFGAKINSLMSEISAGDIIRVPAGQYAHSTLGTITKSCTIVGSPIPQIGGQASQPHIDLQAAVGGLETAENTPVAVCGLRFDSAGYLNSNDALRLRGTSYVDNVQGYGFNDGGATVHLRNETSNDNCNNSIVRNVGSTNSSYAIRTSRDGAVSGGANLNACQFHVRKSFQSNQYAVDIGSGFGNTINCGQIEGGDHVAGVRLDSNNNDVYVTYMEGNIGTGIDITSNAVECTAEVINDGGLSYDNLYADSGVRTLLEGVGTAGTDVPSSGTWGGAGPAEYAYRKGATVLDTSVTPHDRYVAQPDGSGSFEWVEVTTA
jgi:hypothetical protein